MKWVSLLFVFSLTLHSVVSAQITVYDINKKINGSSEPHHLTVFDGKLCLLGNDVIHNEELWSIDTLTAEKLVADVNLINNNTTWVSGCIIFSQHMAVAFVENLNKDALFYLFNNGVNGYELYRYDGISSPVLIKEFVPGLAGVYTDCMSNMVAAKKHVYFNEPYKGVWKYNVNSGIASLIPNSNFIIDSRVRRFIVFKDKVYVNKNNSSGPDKLYVYDEVADSFVLALNINRFQYGRVIGDKLYFIAGNILYQYDGINPPVTIAAAEMEVNTNSVEREFIGSYKGRIYFQGPNNDLYEYHPVLKKTKIIATSTLSGPYKPAGFIEYRDKLYFSAYDSLHGRELWEWDGTNPPQMTIDLLTGVTPTSPIANGCPENFHVIGDGLYFIATSFETPTVGCEVHRYIPTLANVQKLSFKGEVKVYPNPATNNATLEISLPSAQALTVDVYSADGRKVYEVPGAIYSTGTSWVMMPVHDLPTGSYFYHVRNKENTTVVSGKLIKQ